MAKTSSRTKKKGKKYHIELTSLSVLLWGIFLLFLLTWIFVLGILVGRGFLPGTVTTISDLKGQIKKLQEMISQKEPYDPGSLKEPDAPTKLDFYKTLASKKDEVKKNWKPKKQVDVPKEKSPSVKVEELQKQAIVEKEKDVIDMARRGAESLVPNAQYTVQVASIGDVGKAEGLIKQLITQGFNAFYSKVNIKGKTYYRVRCGRFKSRSEAVNYAMKLEKNAGLKGFVSKIE
ncbi:SPOR domain-containing protein [Thermodesulfobacteriota bacterium]